MFSASQRFGNIRRFLFAATAKAALPPTAPHPAACMRARRLTVPMDAQTTVCHANGKCQKFDYLKSRLKSGLFCVVSNSEIGVFEKSFFVIFQKLDFFYLLCSHQILENSRF
jgi:hypothetical protein